MEYQEFEQSFTKENRKLKIILGVNFLVSSGLILLMFCQKKYFLYQGREVFEERPLAEEVCRLGFVGLAQGSPNPLAVDSEVIKHAEKDNFSIPIEKVLMVKSLEEGACSIVLKSEGALSAFKIKLHGSKSNPFYYKLIQLDEIAAKEEE